MLQAENVKRLRAVTIRPDGHLVVIGGDNGQGKSSLLDSIAYAIGGGDEIAEVPIRKGEDHASIILELDDLTIRRTFAPGGRTTLVVEDRKGKRQSSPQSLLDRLTSKATFDPLAFIRMPAPKQAAALQAVVGLDFSALEKERATLFDERTQVNRELAQAQAVVTTLPVHPGAPSVEQGAAGILTEIERAQAVNAHLADLERKNRELTTAIGQADAEMRRIEAENAGLAQTKLLRETRKGELAPRILALKVQGQEQDAAIAELERQLQALRAVRAEGGRELAAAEATLRMIEDDLTSHDRQIASNLATREAQTRRRETMTGKLEAAQKEAVALAPVPIDPLKEKLAQLDISNREARENAAHAAAVKLVAAKQFASSTRTTRIEAIDEEKAAKLAATKFPIPGLSFTDDCVLFNGLPFLQASGADQLRVSVAIAAALNPKLRVMLVRDGSLLDPQSLALLGQLAAEHDLQVWVERVGRDESCSVVIEDGHLGVAPEPL